MEVEVISVSPRPELAQSAVLRVGAVHILLDCGVSESLDVGMYESHAELLARIDIVLISHYDLGHCGALPWLLGAKKLSKPGVRIFATECVRRMGELTVASLFEDVDKVKNVSMSNSIAPYNLTLEDIVLGFSRRVEPVQYNQVMVGCGLSFTAQPCGRLIGGSYWVITAGTERIVYAVDYSLVGDRHVGGMQIDAAKKPSILITSSSPSTGDGTDRASGEQKLISLIKTVLRADGTVLLPSDSNGRVLELLLALENAWAADASLQLYPIVFLSSLGDVVLDQVKTRMEWLNKSLVTTFEDSQNFAAHPFVFSHLQLEASLGEFYEKYSARKPKVVIAPSASLEFGDARELFVRIAADANNLVVFTQTVFDKSALAARVVHDSFEGGSGGVYKETQFVKSPFPDEQLRDLYRENLQKEAQEDELRRRRARDKFLRNQQIAAPSSAAAVPVDLIRSSANYEDTEGSAFFRPQLFVGQTVASGLVLDKFSTAPQDYGEPISSIEVNTWRAHAEMSDLSASREAAMEAGRVKSEQRVKGERAKEEMIKGDIYDEGDKVKGELGVSMAGEGFDWRRDMQMRFGEPQRVEQRERVIKVSCKIKSVLGLEGRALGIHSREFVTVVRPRNLIVLGGESTLGMVLSEGQRFFPCQSEVGLNITGGTKKWLNIDACAKPNFTEMKNGIRIAKLLDTCFFGPLFPQSVPDLIQAPTGDFVEYALVAHAENRKRKRAAADSALLVAEQPLKLANLAKQVKSADNMTAAYVTTKNGMRALAVSSEGLYDHAIVTATRTGMHQSVLVTGVPGPAFYKVRELLYKNSTSI